MSEQPKTRQELYDLIKQTSKDEYILSEMVRLGFWESDKNQPSLPEALIKEKGEVQRELNALLSMKRKIGNPEQLIKEYRQQRMKESREKQEENRKKRELERKERAEKWKERKSKELVYLGKDVSMGLKNTTDNVEKLQEFGLPSFENAAALAKAMEIDLGQLRFLAFNRKVSKISHYKRFYMPKKTGGQRLISAPMPRLKQAQYWILENILKKVKVSEAAHGFVEERSILSNAKGHVGQDVVINFDFKDFFPTVTYKRVKGCFVNLGYSEQLATVLALLCTEPDVDEIEMDGQTYYIASGDRYLPQGAPTSPALTNIICYKLDARMVGTTKSLGWNYTRYADDMSFSTSGEAVESITKLIWRVKQIVESEGFVLHPDKMRIMRKGSRQEVTGIIVNDLPGIDRKHLKRFRALLYQIKQDGMEGKTWGNGKDLAASIWGYANFVEMVKPEKGKQFKEQVKEILGEKALTEVKKRKNRYLGRTLSKQIATAKQELKGKDKQGDNGDQVAWKLW